MEVSLNYCSQNGGNLYRAPYYTGNPNIGPRIMGNLDQYPHDDLKGAGDGFHKLGIPLEGLGLGFRVKGKGYG